MENNMLLLPEPDPELLIVDTPWCYRDLWDKITFTELIRHSLACEPFLWNNGI
jgi:hypothetical protein